MSSFMKKLNYWLCPKTDSKINVNIDKTNINSVHYVTLLVCVMEVISLIIFTLTNLTHLNSPDVLRVYFSVGLCLFFGLLTCIMTWRIRKLNCITEANHNRIVLVLFIFAIGFQLWGMMASVNNYIKGEQIITFYTVELCVATFVKFRPVISIPLILLSYLVFFVWLDFFVVKGMINVYNYIMLALLTAAGAIINYRLTVNDIKRQNRIEVLNSSLERIATHDMMTRLKNRYALNMDIAKNLDCPVCVALGDIDRFKQINDTFGHDTGDVILKNVAETLVEIFGDEGVYRYGGDEFLVVKLTSDYEQFKADIEKVNTRLSAKAIENYGKKVGCSFGYVKSNVSVPVDFLVLITKADKKLYEKKHKSKTGALYEN